MTTLKCNRTIKTNSFGIERTHKCGKPANMFQDDGLPLCNGHFRKWFKKNYKVEYSEFIKQ